MSAVIAVPRYVRVTAENPQNWPVPITNGRLVWMANCCTPAIWVNAHGLKPVHGAVVETCIYVCVAETAPDFDTFASAVQPFLAQHQLDTCKVAHESSIVAKDNWKLVFENNRECYPCEGSPPELLNSFVENHSVAGVADGDDPALTAFWDRCEAGGLPSRLLMAENSQFRMTRIQQSVR